MPELGRFLRGIDTSLEVQGGKAVASNRAIEKDSGLLQIEQKIITELKKNGVAGYQLNSSDTVRFTAALGAGAMMTLGFVTGPNQVLETYATVTPDTTFTDPNFPKGKLRMAFLGDLKNKWVPQNLVPKSPKVVRSMKDVTMYLSGANQLFTTGDHNAQMPIKTVEPRHLLSAVGEYNVGSVAFQQFQSLGTHGGDYLERDRKMMPTISAQSPQNATNRVDMIWAPVSVLPVITPDRPPVNIGVRFTLDMVDPIALQKGMLMPLMANAPDALQELQDMSFATLLLRGNNAQNNFAKEIAKGTI